MESSIAIFSVNGRKYSKHGEPLDSAQSDRTPSCLSIFKLDWSNTLQNTGVSNLDENRPLLSLVAVLLFFPATLMGIVYIFNGNPPILMQS